MTIHFKFTGTFLVLNWLVGMYDWRWLWATFVADIVVFIRWQIVKERYMKKVPEYWWDFEGDEIIVESDDDRFPVVGRFKYDPDGGEEAMGKTRKALKELGMDTKCGAAEKAIEEAEELIEDLNAGRKTPKAC